MKVFRAHRGLWISLTLLVLLGLGVVCVFSGTGFRELSGRPASSDKAGAVWTCSMHPQIRSPKPGNCPICSMPLIPAKLQAPPDNRDAGGEPMLELSEHAKAMAAVETVPVERRKLSRDIRAVGKVQYNETALATITARVTGYVERLFVDFTGVKVKAGDHLVQIYSPELTSGQEELLLASQMGRNPALVAAARERLVRWGMTREQVDEVIRTRKAEPRMTLVSPITGTVTEKMVVQQSAVKPGDVLYKLANLASVWVYLDIYEYELPWIKYGQSVEVTTEAFPNEVFSGRVWFINPVVTEETRTVKVLLNIENDREKLKPGLFVSAVIRAQLLANGEPAPTGLEGKYWCPMHPSVVKDKPGTCPLCGMELTEIPGGPAREPSEEDQLVLVVPVTAVLDSGLRKLVYVERSKGEFVPREIKTGPRSGDFYPVFEGLEEGEKVAARGNFLLDSQFQISGLPSLFYKEGQAGAVGHQHGGASSAGPAKPAAAPKSQGHEGHTPEPPKHQH